MFLLRTIFLYFNQLTMCPFTVPGLMHLSFQGGNMDSFITQANSTSTITFHNPSLLYQCSKINTTNKIN